MDEADITNRLLVRSLATTVLCKEEAPSPVVLKENHAEKTSNDPGRRGGFSKYWKDKNKK